MRYPGGKGKSFPHLLNLMPPHSTYVESHLGGGAVMRHKRPCQRQIGVDLDPNVIAKWEAMADPPCEIVCADAVEYLDHLVVDENTLIYADPPYVGCTRRRSRVYRFDYTDRDHEHLLECLKSKKCMVMLSGYDNPIYDAGLRGWTTISFQSKTHAGIRQETVWLNFPRPQSLHDFSFRGSGFREREAIKRRRQNLQSRIGDLSEGEQYDILRWLEGKLGGLDESRS